MAGALSLASAFVIVGSRRSLVETAGGNRMAARLAAVDAAPGAWRSLIGLFIGALALTASGDALLAMALSDAGERVFSAVGTALYFVAAPIGIAALALQFAFSLWREGGVDRGERRPELFDVSERWAFVLIEIYLVLAFGAIAAYGTSLAATSLVPPWLAAASIALGVAGSLSMVIRRPKLGALVLADLPLWIQVWALAIGAALLLR